MTAADSTAPPTLRTELEELAARTLTAANRAAGLEQRLAAAELVCALYGGLAANGGSYLGNACTQAWNDWAGLPGVEIAPSSVPQAVVADLVRRRKETEAATLERIAPAEDFPEPGDLP